jgi:hypothetical protein
VIPLWAISGLAAAAAAAAIGTYAGYQLGSGSVTITLERERAAWAEERAKAAVATAEWQGKANKAEAAYRNQERTWLDVARSIDSDGLQTAEKLRASSGRADAAIVGLRSQLGAVVADAARASQTCSGATDARERQAAAETTRVFADLLGSCHERGRARALYADQAAAAGASCERWAGALER